jgi:hypothetical protein
MQAAYDILVENPPMGGGLVGSVAGWERQPNRVRMTEEEMKP